MAFQAADGSWQQREAAGSTSENIHALAGALTDELASAEGGKRANVVLWLSGALARPFILEPVAGLKAWREAQHLAQALASEATGLQGPCDVWLDDGLPHQPVLAVALQRSTREAIESRFEKERGLRLDSIKPWWMQPLNELVRQNKPAHLLVVQEPDAWTLLAGHAESFSLVGTCAPLLPRDQATGWVRRSLLGADLPSAEGVCARCFVDVAPAQLPMKMERWV